MLSQPGRTLVNAISQNAINVYTSLIRCAGRDVMWGGRFFLRFLTAAIERWVMSISLNFIAHFGTHTYGRLTLSRAIMGPPSSSRRVHSALLHLYCDAMVTPEKGGGAGGATEMQQQQWLADKNDRGYRSEFLHTARVTHTPPYRMCSAIAVPLFTRNFCFLTTVRRFQLWSCQLEGRIWCTYTNANAKIPRR